MPESLRLQRRHGFAFMQAIRATIFHIVGILSKLDRGLIYQLEWLWPLHLMTRQDPICECHM